MIPRHLKGECGDREWPAAWLARRTALPARAGVGCTDLVTHRLAPDAEKWALFGALELRCLGFFAGPILGGALLDSGTWHYFGVMAALSFAAWPVLRARSLGLDGR
ncbi:hypothetical protein [Streptomyces sp. NPDC051001]|uniref:hypothetical protein n=1 Tax=Streptomyces sp. NPDC051001 TaxID=3155795 RepID=UPI0034272154